MDIGSRLKAVRQSRGISGGALAKLVDLDPSQIYKIESNAARPSLDSLERICHILSIPLSDFFAENNGEQFIPPDISEFAINENNQGLIRLVQKIKGAGYSDEVIREWLTSLLNSLESIRKKYLKDTDTVVIAKDNPTPEELELVEKLKEKMKDPEFRRKLFE